MSTRARRSFNSADPTARAVLAMPTESVIESIEPPPAGGITITSEALLQARSFGMKPYEVAAMQRQVAKSRRRMNEGGNFTFRTHKVYFAAECGMFTITHVQ